MTASTVAAAQAGPSAEARALEAVRLIEAGDLRAAATAVRQSLDVDPGSTLLQNMAATLLMMTGDTAGAEAVWNSVLNDAPDDGLAQYGLGLAALARGDRAKALDRIQLAERSGDRASCLLAQRYIENLSGAVGAGAGLTLPDAYAGSARGLGIVAAARAGDFNRVLAELPQALAALNGDPFAEPPGVMMSFDAGGPLRFGSAPLPAGNGLAKSRKARTDRAYSGVLTLSPDAPAQDTAYVVFKVDGQLAAMVNSRPYRYVWDTAKWPNGAHKVEILVYDRDGRVVNHAEREVRSSNAAAPTRTTPEAEREAQVRAALWQSLTLRPSRHMLAWAGADAGRALRNSDAEERYLGLAAALQPDFKDTRRRMAALCGTAEAAFWRGAKEQPLIALTFDDGPKSELTDLLLATLKREGVPATFFVIGRHVTAYPELARKIVDAGMEIANHSYTHPNLTLLSPQGVERELLRTSASVRTATGKRVRYFRPPGGNINPMVTRVAAEWGLTPVMWTIGGTNFESGNADRLVDYVLKKAANGAIVLLHNERMTTIEALPRIIAGLRQRGFQFVTVEQMAERNGRMSARAGSPAQSSN
jgi:peptidoglycan/xylan/chitin deacetylase (PgdA/CDA1 family)